MKRATRQRNMRAAITALAVALGFVLAPPLASPAFAANPNPAVAPGEALPYGRSYSEWVEAWWTWLVSIPADENPVLDTTGEFAHVGQTEKVFFLAGTLFGGTFEREVTVPAGTPLFFPVFNALWWSPDDLDDAAFFAELAGMDPELMTDEELIRFIVSISVDSPTTLAVTVDGEALADLEGYRASSDAFPLLDTDLIDSLGLEISQPNFAVGDGYWMLLQPLPPGEHTIHIEAAMDSGPFAGVAADVTYRLTVAGGQQ